MPDRRLYALLLAVGLAGGLYALESHVGLNLGDEGFLWYGAIRTAQGDVPIRDFQSYDPGRYYWTAAWFRLLRSDGPLALRAACAGFLCLGLALGLMALGRVVRSRGLLALAGLLIALWMWPHFRSFDSAASLATLFLIQRLIERPSPARHFAAGLGLGLVAFLGRNHGVYAAAATALAMLWIGVTGGRGPVRPRLAAWSAGLFLGCAPMLFMIAFVPGFLRAVAQSVAFLTQRGVTTIPKPIPWPWTVPYANLGWADALSRFSVGALYMALPLFYIGLAWFLARVRRDPVLAASLFTGLPYAHHAFSRAEMYHLASGIHPFLVGVLALASLAAAAGRRLIAAGIIGALAVSSVLAVGHRHRRQVASGLSPGTAVPHTVRGDRLLLLSDEARVVRAVERIQAEIMEAGDEILVVPFWPSLYPVLGTRSPVRTLIFTWPLTEAEQREMIGEIEERSLRFALLCDFPVDNREELRFRRSHALVWAHLEERFEAVSGADPPPPCELWRRRVEGPSAVAPPALPSPEQ